VQRISEQAFLQSFRQGAFVSTQPELKLRQTTAQTLLRYGSVPFGIASHLIF
jgi:hypothetical protein